ncbi:MAG: cytidine/deoxycytidylate deaminase family protein [Akkermansiaceae bacterium]|nr:cytidine/deoxycytidylate deaminase family protein [Armatimonadota bacterium]
METRPPWDEYFMRIAFEVATRATCLRRHVGAVIVRDKRILSTGYNGSPPGQKHCNEVGCLLEDGRCIRTLHAEQNALMQAALHGVSTHGATLYCTCRPCHVCARMIVAAGIVRVVFAGESPEGWANEVLTAAGVEIVPLLHLEPPSPMMKVQNVPQGTDTLTSFDEADS